MVDSLAQCLVQTLAHFLELAEFASLSGTVEAGRDVEGLNPWAPVLVQRMVRRRQVSIVVVAPVAVAQSLLALFHGLLVLLFGELHDPDVVS